MVSLQRRATYVLVKARVVEVDGIRPGIVIPDVICVHIKSPGEDAFLEITYSEPT